MAEVGKIVFAGGGKSLGAFGRARLGLRPALRVLWFGPGLLVLAALSACETRGGEGDGCRSDGIFGPSYCDSGLLCDTPTDTCIKPMSRREGQQCGSNEVCAAGLYCGCGSGETCAPSPSSTTCRPRLGEGAFCGSDDTCDPSLVCSFNLGNQRPICIAADLVIDLHAIVDGTLVAFTDVTASSTPVGPNQHFQVEGRVTDPEPRHLTVRLTAPQGATVAEVTCVFSAAGELEVTYENTAGSFTSAISDTHACDGSFTVISSASGTRLRGQFSATVQGGGGAPFFIGRAQMNVPVN